MLLMTGLISHGLVGHVKKVIGIDTSQGMLDIFNAKAERDELQDKMSSLCMDILCGGAIPEEIKGVDVVVVSMAYHHIDDTDHTSKVLASLLKKGGHLLVLDLLESKPQSEMVVNNSGAFAFVSWTGAFSWRRPYSRSWPFRTRTSC
jgi:SAM-dependent methyltransferase